MNIRIRQKSNNIVVKFMRDIFVPQELVFRLPILKLFKNSENILRLQCTMSLKMFDKI